MVAVSRIGGEIQSMPRKLPTCLSQVTDKLYHIMLHAETSTMNGFELTNYVVIGTYYTCSYKSNYYALTATTAPQDINW